MRTIRSTRELFLEMRNKIEEVAIPDDITLLALEKGSPLEFEDLDVYSAARVERAPGHVPHPLEGYWSVMCTDRYGGFFAVLGLVHFVLSVAPDGSITGFGEAYGGRLNLVGTSVSSGEGLPNSVELKMVVGTLRFDFYFHGTHDPERDTVTGLWEEMETSHEAAVAVIAKADGAVEGVSNDITQGTEPGQDATIPSKGYSFPIDASKLTEADVTTAAEVDAQQTGISTDELDIDEAHNQQEDMQAQLTQADTDVEQIQTTSPAERIVDDEQQASKVPMNNNFIYGTFSMRRTPADIRRFGRNLDSKTDSSMIAKNRWKFALEATRFQVQVKNMSWEYVRARLAERRLWLGSFATLGQKRPPRFLLAQISGLTGECAPSQGRLYEATLKFFRLRGYLYRMYASSSWIYNLNLTEAFFPVAIMLVATIVDSPLCATDTDASHARPMT